MHRVMRMVISAIPTLAVCVAVCALAQNPIDKGVITVKVVDQEGEPVPSAIVKFYLTSKTAILYAIPECRTDESGTCSRNDLPIDSYSIRVMKPSDGYPDTSFKFYSGLEKSIPVALTLADSFRSVLVTLGPKAGKLKLKVVDATSGAEIKNPTIVLRDVSDPNNWVSVGKALDSTILVPPNEDVQVEIVATGYQPWQLREHPNSTGEKTLRLRSGEVQQWTVRLKHQ